MTPNIQLLQMLRGIKNPQQFLTNVISQQMGGNPLFSNLLQLAQNNQTSDIENIARNIFKERGLDYDKQINQLKSMLSNFK